MYVLFCCVVVRLFRCFLLVTFLFFGMCANLFVCYFDGLLFVFVCLLFAVFVSGVCVRFLNV